MKKRLASALRSVADMGFGKTWAVFWGLSILMFAVGGPAHAIWSNMLLVLAYLFQGMACHSRTSTQLQVWFDQVNADRVKRNHQEHLACKLRDYGATPETAKDAASLCVSVLSMANYRLPAI